MRMHFVPESAAKRKCDIIVISASSYLKMPSVWLSTVTLPPKLYVLNICDNTNLLCLFLIMASRLGSCVLTVRLYLVDPMPARRTRSWSLAERSWYLSKTNIFSPGIGDNLLLIDSTMSDTCPLNGHTMWYRSWLASIITNSGTSRFWVCTHSLWTSCDLLPLL